MQKSLRRVMKSPRQDGAPGLCSKFRSFRRVCICGRNAERSAKAERKVHFRAFLCIATPESWAQITAETFGSEDPELFLRRLFHRDAAQLLHRAHPSLYFTSLPPPSLTLSLTPPSSFPRCSPSLSGNDPLLFSQINKSITDYRIIRTECVTDTGVWEHYQHALELRFPVSGDE